MVVVVWRVRASLVMCLNCLPQSTTLFSTYESLEDGRGLSPDSQAKLKGMTVLKFTGWFSSPCCWPLGCQGLIGLVLLI